MSDHSPKSCNISNAIFKYETNIKGLQSVFTFICKMCNKQFTINTEEDYVRSSTSANLKKITVSSTMSIGCGYS